MRSPSHVAARRCHVAWILGLGGFLAIALPRRADPETDRYRALAHALQCRGILAAPEDIQWIDRPGPPLGGSARAIVRGAPSRGEPNDVFLV
jgi:hypothetical protein